MKWKRLLSWVLTFAMIAGMFVVPARADDTITITQDTEGQKGQMTITLEIPKKTPAASDLTYTAPADLAYSGSEKTATVAAASGVTGMGDITVKYYSDAARTTEAAPKNVGTYYVGATVAEGDNYTASTGVLYGDGWTFTITKSTPSAPAAPTAASTAAKSITLTTVDGCEYSKDGTNYQDSPTFTGLTPSTSYTFYQRIKETANNNASPASSATISTTADTYAMTITLVVKAKDPVTVTKAPTAKKGLKFNDSDQVLVNVGTASGGTMQYALGANATTAPTSGWSTSAPTGKAVGTYYVWYKAVGDSDHTDSAAACVTVSISEKDPATVTTVPTAKTGLTFNGGDQELVSAGTASGGTMQYALGANATTAPTTGWGASVPTGKAVGTYYVWYKVVGDADHTDTAPVYVTVSIEQTPLTGVTIYAIPDQNSTGEQLKPEPVVKHLGYLLKKGEDYDLSYGENKTVGTATGSVTVTGKGGYSGTLNKTFNIILPAYSGTLTVTAPGPYTYGTVLGAAPAVTSSTGSLTGETVKVYYATTPSGDGTAWNSSAKLNAGTYYVWAELAATSTHDKATSERVTFTVNKATPAAPSGVLRASYTDTYKVTLTIPSGKTYADYEYSTNDSTWTALPALKDGAFTPTGLNSGTNYTIYLRTKADSNNNASAAATATLKTPAKYLLSYDANGSTASVPASVEYDSGSTVTAAAAITRAGYTFAGWKTGATSGTNYAAGATFTISANTTLYAQWTANSYTVQYNANGGTGTIADGSFTYGTAAALSDGSGLSRSGYTFRGWATSASGDVVYSKSQKVSTLTTEKNGTVTLYAVWTQDTYKVSGTVMEELDGTTEKSIVAGVTVKIVRGNVEFATTTTGDDGTYEFTGVPTGTYNIVATRTVDSKTQTMTALVEVKSNKTVDSIVLPPSKINSVLTVTGDSTPPVMVGGLEEVAKDEAETSKEVTVTMTVEKKDESSASAEIKQQIEEIKEAVAEDTSTDSGSTELEFLDVSVKKETTESGSSTTTETITETSQVVEIIVSFNMNGRFGFSLYRHHDGKAEAFQSRSSRFAKDKFADGYYFADKTAGLFYIYTNRFSTYAIGFEEGTGYTVTVNSGTGGGDYAEGAIVTITADAALSGKVFDKWTTSDGVTFANDSSATTTFVMPTKAVTVTATYKAASAPDSGGNGDTITVPVSGDTASVSVSASVSGTTATVKAPTTAELNKVIGESVKTGDVTIDVSGLNKNIATVSIPTETVKAIEKAVSDPDNDADALTIKLTDGSVTFDTAALAAIVDQAKGSTIQLNLDGITESGLRAAQKTAIADMDVQALYDAYMTSNGTRISDFKGGSAKVTVTYTLGSGQTAGGVVVWYVADNGDKTEVPTTCTGKEVTFTVEHFSNYVVAYDEARAAVCPKDDTCPISAFTDADPTAWYHDGVHYVLENSIMSGYNRITFAPNDTTTRAMMAQILWNMEGKPASNYTMSYTDVDGEAWYTEAVRWATAEKIMSGYGGGKFGPGDAMTREQLVTIMYRYAQYKGVDVSIGDDTNILSYDDALTVSEFAIPAMQWAVGSGAVGGRTNTTLNPKDTATRAEIATIIMRYCTEIAK